jgi:hypothetical protein
MRHLAAILLLAVAASGQRASERVNVSGKITVEGGISLPTVMPATFREGSAKIELWGDDKRTMFPTNLQASGVFQFERLPPMIYTIKIPGLRKSLYMKSVRWNGADITEEPKIDLRKGGGKLEIVLAPKPAEP